MRILLREKSTGRFLMENGKWSSRKELACNFYHTNKDHGLRLKREFRALEWLYVFDYPEFPEYDFAVQMAYAQPTLLPSQTSSANQANSKLSPFDSGKFSTNGKAKASISAAKRRKQTTRAPEIKASDLTVHPSDLDAERANKEAAARQAIAALRATIPEWLKNLSARPKRLS
jgi:hypothetical protein